MEIVYFLLPASLLLAGIGFVAYRWAVKNGQFDDLDTPPLRILVDDAEIRPGLEKEPGEATGNKNS